MSQFATIVAAPDAAPPSEAEFVNYVSLGTVGLDPEDPSLAFVRVVDGQVLVEVELAGDGDAVNAYLCHSQTGAVAGDYIPVEPGDAVVLVWPDGQAASPYIIARLADVERQLAGSCCGLATTSPGVRQFRWLRTPTGQIYAVQSGGEMLLEGSSVRITGAQVLLNGETHLGADFLTPPVPGQPIGGTASSPSVPAAPFVPDLLPSLATIPPAELLQRAQGIVRFSDEIEANVLTDPDFIAWLAAANGVLTLAAVLVGLPWPFPDPPVKLTSRANTASVHTANDPPPV